MLMRILLNNIYSPSYTFSFGFPLIDQHGIPTVNLTVLLVMFKPSEPAKQPIRARYLGHVTGYQPITDQQFLIRSVPACHVQTLLCTVQIVARGARE